MSETKVLSHEAESLQRKRLNTINALKRRYVAPLTASSNRQTAPTSPESIRT